MTADPETNAYLDCLRGEVADLRKELAAYAAGARAGKRLAGLDWVDITDIRVSQINREIDLLEKDLARHGHHA